MSKKISRTAMLVCVPLFVIISSASASVMRASLMSTFFIMGLLVHQPVRLMNGIGFSALIILILNPNEIFDVGFQLTYLVTLSLLTIGMKIRGYFPRWGSYLWVNISFSLASQAATIFHCMFLYHRVSFVSPVLNLIGVPLFALILILSLLFILIPVEIIRFALSMGVKTLLWLFFWIVKYFVGFTWSYQNIGAPHPFSIAVGLASVVILLYVHHRFVRIGAVVILFVIIVLSYGNVKTNHNLEVMMLDVGYGDSLLVRFPDRKTLLIDGGGSVLSDFDIGKNVVAPALREQGITQIDYIMLTHEHPDHSKGLPYIIKEFKVKELWDSNCSPEKPLCKELLYWARQKKVKRKLLFTGDVIKIGRVEVKVVHSPVNRPYTNVNNNSIIIELSVYGRTLLFTGDGEREVEEILLHQYKSMLKASIIKIPHHGSTTSSHPDFLDAVQGKIALLSVGRNNYHGLPAEEVLSNYLTRGYEIYRTDCNGQILLTITPQGNIEIKEPTLTILP